MQQNPIPFRSLESTDQAALQRLASRTIFFGHQSVGYNIIHGIQDLMKENDLPEFKILEITKDATLTGPVFAHSPVGENGNPKSKVDEFKAFLQTGKKIDIAFLKLCFVDISFHSDIDAELKYYLNSLREWEQAFPETRFIYMTVPLTVYPRGFINGIKNTIKKISGQPRYGIEDNLKKQEFNRKLIQSLAETAPLFDIALFESTYPDGRRPVHKKGSEIFYSLADEYTDDGGHLNELGRKVIAEQLLIFLSDL